MRGLPLSRLTVLAVLGAVAAFLTYLAVLNSDNPPSLLNHVTNPDPMDLYVVAPHGNKYDENGRLVQTLEAQRLTHFRTSNRSDLVEPRLHIHTRKNTIWDGSAKTGSLLGDTEVRLRDNVVVAQRDGLTRLTTSQLNYFPKAQKVDSAVTVALTRAADTTTAVGMRGDLNTNRVELLSRVEGRHVLP